MKKKSLTEIKEKRRKAKKKLMAKTKILNFLKYLFRIKDRVISKNLGSTEIRF